MVVTLIEFSGGVGINSGWPKEEKDVIKLLPSLINVNQARNMPFPITTFCVRFANLDLHFEPLTTVKENVYALKKYVTLTCPTTSYQLKAAVAQFGELFKWKHAVLQEVDKMLTIK